MSQLTELLLHSSCFFGWLGPHLFFELFVSSLRRDALFTDLVRINGGDVERTCLIASGGCEFVLCRVTPVRLQELVVGEVTELSTFDYDLLIFRSRARV